MKCVIVQAHVELGYLIPVLTTEELDQMHEMFLSRWEECPSWHLEKLVRVVIASFEE